MMEKSFRDKIFKVLESMRKFFESLNASEQENIKDRQAMRQHAQNCQIADEVRGELSSILKGEKFPYIREITCPASFRVKGVRTLSNGRIGVILAVMKKEGVSKLLEPELLIERFNDTLRYEVNYNLLPSCGADLQFMFPALAAGMYIKAAKDAGEEIYLLVVI